MKNKSYTYFLSHYFSQAATPVRFISDDSSYESMKTLGLSIISNIDLGKEIINIQDFSYDSTNTLENAEMLVEHNIRTD